MDSASLRHAGQPHSFPQLPSYGLRFTFMITILAIVPFVTCSTGDEFSNNLFTDVSPLLALFGEQVTKQFLSDAMGWSDHILFAMVPLGIITAMISAIRCGGPRWLKAIVGRAKESRAMVELELMSSTSADVCELWNGHNIVRVIGNPSIMEIFYSKSTHSRGVYLFEEMISEDDKTHLRLPGMSRHSYYEDQEDIPMNSFEDDEEDRPLLASEKFPPNISLNAHGDWISRGEMWAWAFFGIALQLGLLGFAGFSSYYRGWGNTFYLGNNKQEQASVWAVTLVCVGTLALVTGMMLCCYLIDKCSKERRFTVERGIDFVWLQKGGSVGEQNFGSYAIFAKAADYNTRQKFIKSHRDPHIDNPPPTFRTFVVWATLLSFCGFIIQFVGMRNIHWSFPVAQLGCTFLMTGVRAWVRRSLFSEPQAKEIEAGHELDFLARYIGGKCGPWAIDLAPIGPRGGVHSSRTIGDIKHTIIVDRVFHIRKRLGTLSHWESHLGNITSSLCKAIDGVMNALHGSEYIILKDTLNPNVFTWNVRISTGDHDGPVAEIPLQIQAKRSSDNNSTHWAADQKALEALLSLLLEKKMQSTHAPTYRRLFFDCENAWERQIFKWWINHRNLPINGWPQADSSTSGPDGSLWVYVAELDSLCAQEVFASFFSEATKQLIERIEGPVELRLAGGSGLHAFGLGCDVLASLAEIVSGSGLSTGDEAFIGIVDLLAFHRKLPEPRAAIPSIYKRLQNPTLPNPIDTEEFLFHIVKAQITIYLRREEPDWEPAARFLIEQLQVLDDPNGTIHTCLVSMLVRLFRQASGLGKLPGMSRLWKKTCTKVLPTTTLGFRPGSTLKGARNSPQYPLTEGEENRMIRECLQATPRYRFRVTSKLLEAAVDAGYDSVVDLILTLGTNQIFTTTELQALESSFNKATNSSNGVLIDIFTTHLHTFAATGSLRLKEINGEHLIRTLFFKGFDSAKKLLISPDIPVENNLQRAAVSGFLNVVELLLENGADINAQSEVVDEQMLYAAVKNDDKDVTEGFLATYVDGLTALQAAARGGHLHVVQVLLEKGADINALANGFYKVENDGAQIYPRRCGQTALHIALIGGHYDVAEVLLAKGADINTRAKSGPTILQVAAEHGHQGTVGVLLEKGVDINAKPADNGGRTALQAAAGNNHLRVVQLLLDNGADVNAKPAVHKGRTEVRKGRTALQAAAEGGYFDLVQLLVGRGANINATPAEFEGRTALQAAAGGGHLDLVQLLLGSGADINAEPAEFVGRTALQAASEGGYLGVVQLLVERGADINARPAEVEGRTALQAAAGGGHLDVVQWLLYRGASPNEKPAEGVGRTALQAAAGGGHLRVVQALLKKGADVNAKPAVRKGRRALQAAAGSGHLDIVQLLLKRGADVNAKLTGGLWRTALQAAAGGGYLEVTRLLLEEGADVNTKPTEGIGRTALQAAAEGGHLDLVMLLVDRGADVNARPAEIEGRTALQAAAGGGYLNVVQFLLDRGADVNADSGGYDGRTALQAAAEGGHIDVARLLVDREADPDEKAPGLGSRTALQEAAWGNHRDLVQLLRRQGASELEPLVWGGGV